MLFYHLCLTKSEVDLLHSLYYSIDHFIEGTSGSIVLCISPPTSLMMDQREKYAPKGISSEFVGGDQTDPIVIKKILEGAVQLVFITPESIIENTLYRNMLLSQPYIDRLVALVVDEAHCVSYGVISLEKHLEKLEIFVALFQAV